MDSEPESRGHTYIVPDDRLGLFTVVGVFLMIAALMWWKTTPLGENPQKFSIIFSHIAGLNANAPVHINGMRVGKVDDMELLGKDSVRVKVSITSDKVRVPEGSLFHIYSNGLVGAKYIDVTLPAANSGKQALLGPGSIVHGADPARPEIIVETVSDILDEVDIKRMQDRIDQSLLQVSIAADNVAVLSKKFQPAAEHTVAMEKDISMLSRELTGTTRRINRFLKNPKVGADLKETAYVARETAQRVQLAMDSLNSTLMDETLRKDLKDSLCSLYLSTQNVREAVSAVERVGADESMRGDFKQIASDARATMEGVNKMVSKPGFGKDLKGTVADVRKAVRKIDLVGTQLSNVLDKRFPLFHLMFGRPGKIENAVERQTAESGQIR